MLFVPADGRMGGIPLLTVVAKTGIAQALLKRQRLPRRLEVVEVYGMDIANNAVRSAAKLLRPSSLLRRVWPASALRRCVARRQHAHL
ncbi:hypothetical protein BG74_08430 [Sodalis-like endosymbiont of Proechinophthirus fluctus]|uniref:hypothetical protein n=1 Tax=Sodalis-like endosymbiont of Proechinophthirus fluctus TaxID=1462730 RepID=UPI0007A8E854|nr:hypothetical protein [Sodalis-like endosymbiont of Proechinophthirus fluctus]KYP95665.1 hypothetical protein BG74_08430 [Sodalis-like endosymbiont of Proechinophthirus fluctus]